MKIGIPRALLYYWYGSQWNNFWSNAGCEVFISPETNREIMMAGVGVALHELCLPVKIFLGHALYLAPKVDLVMVPHLIKVESDAYICPKFMGLPDIVKHALPSVRDKFFILKQGPKEVDGIQCLIKAARKLGIPQKQLAEKEILKVNQESPCLTKDLEQNQRLTKTELTIGLLGHPYCLYDPCLNINLLQFLTNREIKILTPELMPAEFRGIGSGQLNKKMFWTTGRVQFDALHWMLTKVNPPVDGFIEIAPFACGPEAIVSDMLERRIKEANKPFLKIYYEEHSGEAGMITRLEAFLDLMRYHSTAC